MQYSRQAKYLPERRLIRWDLSIYRRKGSKYFYIHYYRNGQSFVESTHSEKMEVAKRLLKLREGEVAQGKLPGICFDRISFNELAGDYLLDHKINGRQTIDKSELYDRRISEEFGNMKVTDITTSRIKHYIQKRLDQGYANAYINRDLAALKRMFNLGLRCTPC